MRAAILEHAGEIRLVTLQDPGCPPGGILVRVYRVGLCASDLKMWTEGHRDMRLPRVLGHEFSGVILESNRGEEIYRVGRRVAVWPGVPCGGCRMCTRGEPHLCSRIRGMGFHVDGGLGERVAVPGSTVEAGGVIPLPEGLPFDRATLAEPLACCVNAQDKLRVGPGDRVLVFGAGVLGRLHRAWAWSRGADVVVLADPDEARVRGLESAVVVDREGEEWKEAVREALGGGADVVIPACSRPEAVEWGFEFLERGGRIAFFSGLGERGRVSLPDHDRVHYQEWVVAGVYGCSPRHMRVALDWMSSRGETLEGLITHRLPLEGVERGLELMRQRRALKVVLAHG